MRAEEEEPGPHCEPGPTTTLDRGDNAAPGVTTSSGRVCWRGLRQRHTADADEGGVLSGRGTGRRADGL